MLSDANKAEWEKVLKENDLMNAQDMIIDHIKGDYWSFGQIRGNYFFTNENMIFVGGLGGTTCFSIKYHDIQDLKLSMINLFIPTGITVTAINRENGKTKRYKCSVLKRKDWMAYIAQRAGITL